MIEFKKKPGETYLELGGGSRPMLHPRCMGGNDVAVDVRMCFNEQGQQTVDFEANFNNLMPEIGTGDFDGVFGHFCMEHVSFRKIPQFLGEVYRVLKPGGRAVFCIPDTRAQIRWLLSNPQGWDGKDAFESASEMFFGSQDYDENAHKAYFDPEVAKKLFTDAGFISVNTTPYGARDTDMCVEAYKPGPNPPGGKMVQEIPNPSSQTTNIPWPVFEAPKVGAVPPEEDNTAWLKKLSRKEDYKTNVLGTNVSPQGKEVTVSQPTTSPIAEVKADPFSGVAREELFSKRYFDGGRGVINGVQVGGYAREGYRDFPVHWVTFQHVMARRPESVLELGCAKGHIVKRLQSAGVRACGLEISRHCWMTRACEGIINLDICTQKWPYKDQEFDLCFSIAVMEHIPEEHLPHVFSEMRRVSKRGLHGIDFGEKDDGFDKTHCTLRTKEWWEREFRVGGIQLPEILDKEDLEKGEISPAVLQGDGKFKLNIGCYTLMHHWGWVNTDVLDLNDYARSQGYNFVQHDARQPFPIENASVDLIYCVKPGAMVKTYTGMKKIEDVRVGDKVLTHQGRWQAVTRTFNREVKDELMTEFYGPCQPFSLTGNHEVYVQRASKDAHGVHHYHEDYQWLPAELVNTNDRVLLPFPPTEERVDDLDLAEFVDEVNSGDVRKVLAARKEGRTYSDICENYGLSWGQVRGWVSQDKLPRGCVLVEDSRIRFGNSAGTYYRRIPVNEQLGRFLGYLLSDGWASGPQFGFVFSRHQQAYIDDVINLTTALFGVRCTSSGPSRQQNTLLAKFCNKSLSGALKAITGSVKGVTARKRIPRNLFRCGHHGFYRGLVVGLWRGDGTVAPTYASYSSIDRRLIYQLQEVLYRLDIASRIGKVITYGGAFSSKAGAIYRLHVSGQAHRTLCGWLGEDFNFPQREIRQRGTTSPRGIVTPVRTRTHRYSGMVYNLEVRGDNSYTLNSVAVHNCSHFLEHLSYDEGLAFLKECRRMIRPDGAMRILVPDAYQLCRFYADGEYYIATEEFGSLAEISNGVEKAPTSLRKLWELLMEGHKAMYDTETLVYLMKEAGFLAWEAPFGRLGSGHGDRNLDARMQIVRETYDTFPPISLVMEAVPA